MNDETPQRVNEFGQVIGPDVPNWTGARPALPTTLAGSFCRLESLSKAKHMDELFSAFIHDPNGKMWTYMPVGPFTKSSFEKWISWAAESEDPMFFAIIDQKSGKAIGFASYLRINPEAGSIEVGYIAYSPLLQRTPVATETMFLMMKHAFDDLGYRRYEWKCDNLNAASKQAAERLGFTFEGVFRQAMVNKGRNRDTAWYSVVDGEWPQLKPAFEKWLSPDNFDALGQQLSSLSKLT